MLAGFTEQNFVKELRNEINSEVTTFNKITIDQIKEIAKERNVRVRYSYLY